MIYQPYTYVGDMVHVQPLDKTGSWSKGSVVKKVAECSYLVRTDQSNILRRNRKLLRSTGELQDVTVDGMAGPVTEL